MSDDRYVTVRVSSDEDDPRSQEEIIHIRHMVIENFTEKNAKVKAIVKRIKYHLYESNEAFQKLQDEVEKL